MSAAWRGEMIPPSPDVTVASNVTVTRGVRNHSARCCKARLNEILPLPQMPQNVGIGVKKTLRGWPNFPIELDLAPELLARNHRLRCMSGQFWLPFVICPTESRNLLNSARQITATHPVSSNLTPSPLGSAWVRNHRGLKSAGLGQNSSVPLSEFSSRPFWDLHVIVRILSRPS